MRNEFLHLVVGIEIDFVDPAEIAIENHARRNQQAVGIAHAGGGKIAEGHEIADTLAAFAPVLVNARAIAIVSGT